MRELDVRLDRIVRDLVEEVGPPVPLGARRLPTAYVHDLYRHLAACDLAVVQGGLTTAQGLSPAELTARTGHSDQDTTLNVYSHVIAPEEATQSAVEALFVVARSSRSADDEMESPALAGLSVAGACNTTAHC